MRDAMNKKTRPVKKKYPKPDLGENLAMKPGSGKHSPPRRQKNKFLKEIQEEIDLMIELRQTGGG